MTERYGESLRRAVSERDVLPFIGIYDVFSAGVASQHFDAVFCSGFGFAASYYGLPDIGFIAWSDMLNFVQRVRTILPDHHILVDIDDGYCDIEVAAHVATQMERVGASGVVLEDQKRPRMCGHFEGKQIMPLDEFLPKLSRVLDAREDLFVIARTDSSDPDDVARRLQAFVDEGADALLVDGVKDLDIIEQLASHVRRPLTFNQIAGGKSPPTTLSELQRRGVQLVIYSTPLLFAAQEAMDLALQDLRLVDGQLPHGPGIIGVKSCTSVLQENHRRTRARIAV